MTLQFIDGFDHITTSDLALKWDTVSGITVSSTQTRGVGGGGAAVSTSDTQYIRKMGLGAHSTYILGAAFYVTQLPLDWNFFTFWETTAQAQLCVRLFSNGVIAFYRGNEAANIFQSTNPLMAQLNTWHTVQCKLVVSPTVGQVILRIDGSQVVTLTGANTQGGATTNVNGVGIGSPFPGASSFSALYTDDFYALNGAGTVNNDWLPAMRVATLRPSGAGNYSQFTANGASPNYACVSDTTQDGDTTYVSGSLPSNDSYTITSLPSAVLGVAGVQINLTARKDDTVSTGIVPLQRSTGIDGLGPASGDLSGSTYSNWRTLYENSLVTGLPWTPAEINASEFGVEIKSLSASLAATGSAAGRFLTASLSASATMNPRANNAPLVATASMTAFGTAG